MSKNDHEHLLDRIFEQNKMAKNDHEHLFDSFTGLALNVGKREHRKDAVPITPELYANIYFPSRNYLTS